MKYIYDIILNFNDKYYDFFEWDDKDNIEYIKKIPVFKVSNEVIRDLKIDKIQVDLEFLKNIYNKTDIYTNIGINKVEYICLFCSNDSVIGVEFNSKGISMYKSDLLIEESLDIIDYCSNIKEIKLNYKIIDYEKIKFITRKEENMINFIKRELKYINESKDIDKLKYLYYECFNKESKNLNIIVDLEKYMLENPIKLYNLLMLSYSTKFD
jgi:hypothetical protein